MIDIKITDPDGLAPEAKKHAFKFEVSPGQWTVVHLDDAEFFGLWFEMYSRAVERKMF